MGRNSQKRRAEKQRKDQQRRASSSTRGGAGDGRWSGGEAVRVEHVLMTAAAAGAHGGAADRAAVAESVVAYARQVGAAAFTPAAGRVVADGLVPAWEGGWQPSELVRHARRRCGDEHADLLVAALGAPATWVAASGQDVPPSWAGQLTELGVEGPARSSADWFGVFVGRGGRPFARAVAVLLETIGFLRTLPIVEALILRPSEWSHPVVALDGRDGDHPVLAKIRALLAKAESTGFEAESEALTAKAQELMARHAIEEVLARAAAPHRESPLTRRIPVDDPYIAAKSLLLGVVARANGVRCVWDEELAWMSVVGFGSDLEAVETLFTSLLVQASRAMLAKGKVTDGRGRSRTRSFRQSFLVAFADRIGERLALAATDARRQAETEMSTSLVPVLADRDREVDEAVARAFPHVRTVRGPSVTNEAGWRAGRTAAELATLGAEQAMMAAG